MYKFFYVILLAILLNSCIGHISPDRAENLALSACSEADSLLTTNAESSGALRVLLEADSYARQSRNDTLRAQILLKIGNIFFTAYKPGDARKYFDQALEFAEASGNTRMINRCRLAVAAACHALNEHTEAIDILKDLINYARTVKDRALLQQALAYTGNSYAHLERFPEAIETFWTLDREAWLTGLDSCILLYSLAKAHLYDEYLKLEREIGLPDDNAQLAFAREAYYSEIGDEKKLYAQSEIVSNSIADNFYESFNDGLLESVHEYFNLEQELKNRQLELHRMAFWGAIIIIVIIATGLLLYHRYRLRLKNAELSLALSQLHDMTCAENNYLQANALLRRDIAELFKNQWSTLNVLCNEFFEKGDTPLRKTILAEVENEIKRATQPAAIRRLAEALDRHFDNIITRLREQIPDLSEKDLTFLIFTYAGFSPRAICLFTGYTLKYYYKKRAVLKERLLNSGVPDANIFADFLGEKAG